MVAKTQKTKVPGKGKRRLTAKNAGPENKSEVLIPSGVTPDVDLRTVPVEFFVPDDLDIKYADNFNAFFSDYDFTLTFLQTQAPLIFRDEDWETAKSVKAKGVSRVVLPPHLIPRIINVLSENWQKFLQVRQKQLQELKHVNATDDTEAGNQPTEGGQP